MTDSTVANHKSSYRASTRELLDYSCNQENTFDENRKLPFHYACIDFCLFLQSQLMTLKNPQKKIKYYSIVLWFSLTEVFLCANVSETCKHGTVITLLKHRSVGLFIFILLSRQQKSQNHDGNEKTAYMYNNTMIDKGKVLPYSLPNVGLGADPGVQAVSPQVVLKSSRQ